MSEDLYQITDRVALKDFDVDLIPDSVFAIPAADLRHLVFKATGTWPNRAATRRQLHLMLWHKSPVTQGSVGLMRIRLEAFIRDNKGNLSLHCHGQCQRHPDAMVAACYMELLQDSVSDIGGGIEDLVNGNS